MSAVDKTSGSQFGWVEVSKSTQTPESEGVAKKHRGDILLKYVDKSSIAHENRMGTAHDYADSHATARAVWDIESPRPYTKDEHMFGDNVEESGQGRLLTEGHEKGPTLLGLKATSKGRFASARAVGMLANMVENRTGREMGASDDLSSRSAPLVSKLTGEKAEQTNDIQLSDTPTRLTVPEAGASTQRLVEDERDQSATLHRNRWVPDDVVKAGGQRLRETMRARRVPRAGQVPEGMPHGPDYQGELFPEPGGHTAESYQASSDNAGRIEAHLAAEERRTARRERGWKPAF